MEAKKAKSYYEEKVMATLHVGLHSITLLQSPFGCPRSSAKSGVLRLNHKEEFMTSDIMSNFKSKFKTDHFLRLNFCYGGTSLPIQGSYCIFKSANSSCPTNFVDQSDHVTVSVNWSSPFATGALPSGKTSGDSKTLDFCCYQGNRDNDNISDDVESFVLLKAKGEDCPTYTNLNVSEEFLTIPNELIQELTEDCQITPCPDVTTNEDQTTFHLCLYTGGELYPSHYPLTCDYDWRFFDGNCYWFSDRRLFWQEAREDCAARGSTLASIISHSERKFVTDYALSQEDVSTRVWIGMFDQDIEGDWKWVSGEPFDPSLEALAQGEPNDKDRSEDCGDMWSEEMPGQIPGEWNDEYCALFVLNYVCKKMPLGDVTNHALKRTVEAPELQHGVPSFLVDENSRTCVTTKARNQHYFIIDLQKRISVQAVKLMRGNISEEALSLTVVVSDSNRPQNAMTSSVCAYNVIMEFLTTFLMCENIIRGRFMFVIISIKEIENTGISAVEMCEVQVFGEALPCSLPIGVSTGDIKALQMTSSSHLSDHEPHKARFGGGSYWCSGQGDLNPRLLVDLGNLYTIIGFAFVSNSAEELEFSISYSNEIDNTTELEKIFTMSETEGNKYMALLDSIEVRRLQLTFTASDATCIALELYGCTSCDEDQYHMTSEKCPDKVGFPAYRLPQSGLKGITQLLGMKFDCRANIKSIKFYAGKTGTFQLAISRPNSFEYSRIEHMLTIEANSEGLNEYTIHDDVTVQPNDHVIICCDDVLLNYANIDDVGILLSELMLVAVNDEVRNISVGDIISTENRNYHYITVALNVELTLDQNAAHHLDDSPSDTCHHLVDMSYNSVCKNSSIKTIEDTMDSANITYSNHGCSDNSWIASPNYPEFYGNDVTKTWNIEAPTGSFIQITMDRFDLDHRHNSYYTQTSEVCDDVLFFYDKNSNSTLPFFTAEHSEFPLLMTSFTDIEVRLSTCIRESPQRPLGFLGRITYQTCAGCGIGVQETEHHCFESCGYIASPNFPLNYDHKSDILWIIEIQFGRYIALNFTQMKVESSYPNCAQDKVIVSDYMLSGEVRLLGVNCVANVSEFPYYSSWNKIQVRLVTDDKYANSGFFAEYSSLKYNIRTELKDRITYNDERCPPDGVSFGTSCYWLVTMASGVTWREAHDTCVRFNGHLVTIMDATVMTTLHYLLTSKWRSKHPIYYIGLSDGVQEGIYKWYERPMVYSAWANTSVSLDPQPDGGSLENCVVIKLETLRAINQWHDVPCSKNEAEHLICEHQIEDEDSLNKTVNNSMQFLLKNTNKTVSSLPDHLWRCHNDEIITITRLCDDKIDCFDKSDELNCSNEVDECEAGRFRCGTSSQCIPVSLLCDFVEHCINGADEQNCVKPTCSSEEFACDNGQCIPQRSLCDLIPDCEDRSDEKDCKICSRPNTFQCFDGRCIPWHARCDGVKDCAGCDGEDEVRCIWSPFSLCGDKGEGPVQCRKYPEERYGEIQFNTKMQTSFVTGQNQDILQTTVAYSGLNTDDDIIHIMERSIQCRQTISTTCDPASITWTTTKWNHIQMSHFCSSLNESHECEITLSSRESIPIRAVNINGTSCKARKDIDDVMSIGAFICTAEMLADEKEGYFTCANGQVIEEKYRCIFEIDEYDMHFGCRDMSHLHDCDAIPEEQKECKENEQGMYYQGTKNVTKTGLPCQRWDTQYPHVHQFTEPSMFLVLSMKDVANYCRNAGGQLPWCFTLDPNVRAEDCDIPVCGNATTYAFECPPNYYMCPEAAYCIPTRYICDGEWQCPGGHDELFCEQLECPAHYRCSGSLQCVPQEHICDGKRHCPLADDEKYCKRKACPDQCSCAALSVNCGQSNFTKIPRNIDRTIRQLDMNGNQLTVLKYGILRFHFLIQLNLANNWIRIIEENTFVDLRNLEDLNLSDNRLFRLSLRMFDGLMSLTKLDLTGNHDINLIDPFTFKSMSALPNLDLSGLNIYEIKPYTFSGLTELKTLTIIDSRVDIIRSESFQDLENLQELDLRGNPLHYVKTVAFKELKKLTLLKSDTFKLCCMAEQVPREQCEPPQDPISSCKDLMSNVVLRAFIWILGILACFGNVVVIVLRCKNPLTNVPEFIISNLAVSDLQMGIYLLIIASVDLYYQGRFIEFSDIWRESSLCTMAGILATFSNEASIAFLVLLTTDRFINIVMPFSKFKLKMKSIRIAVVIIWLVSLVISVIPACPISYFGDNYYGRSSVCMALPITNERPQGWEYATAVFVYVNLGAVIYIGVAYIIMYTAVRRSMSLSRNLARSSAVARNMALIVLTDFLCWMPICALGVAALRGATIPGSVYAWVIVFVLPVNSAINPILYTFSTRHPVQTLIRRVQRAFGKQSKSDCSAGAVSITSIKALEGHRVAALSVINSRENATLRDYLRSDVVTLGGGVRLLKSLTETVVALHELGLVHGKIDSARVYLDWDDDQEEPTGVRLSGLRDAQLIETEEQTKDDVMGIGLIARDVLTAWAVQKNKCISDRYGK